jgi:hypothetical protein
VDDDGVLRADRVMRHEQVMEPATSPWIVVVECRSVWQNTASKVLRYDHRTSTK